jgi:hypothetical protein
MEPEHLSYKRMEFACKEFHLYIHLRCMEFVNKLVELESTRTVDEDGFHKLGVDGSLDYIPDEMALLNTLFPDKELVCTLVCLEHSSTLVLVEFFHIYFRH